MWSLPNWNLTRSKNFDWNLNSLLMVLVSHLTSLIVLHQNPEPPVGIEVLPFWKILSKENKQYQKTRDPWPNHSLIGPLKSRTVPRHAAFVPYRSLKIPMKDYNPWEVFHSRRTKIDRLKISQNMTKMTKIEVSRNPFWRLYSAWKDKSRTFRFENGSVGKKVLKLKLPSHLFQNWRILL